MGTTEIFWAIVIFGALSLFLLLRIDSVLSSILGTLALFYQNGVFGNRAIITPFNELTEEVERCRSALEDLEDRAREYWPRERERSIDTEP